MKFVGPGGIEVAGPIATTFEDGLRTFSNVAAFAANGPTTGAIKFTLPEAWSDTMLRAAINGFDATGGRFEVQLGGLNDSAGPGWLVPTARIHGTAPFHEIRLGFQANASRTVLLLGDTATVWDSPAIHVAEVTAASANMAGWGSNWSSSLVTDESNLSHLVTAELDQPSLSGTEIVRHGVLTPNTVTPVTFTSALNTVEVMSVDGQDIVYFTVDGVDPVPDANDIEILPPIPGASLQLGFTGTGSHTVKLLSAAAVRYSLRTMSAPVW